MRLNTKRKAMSREISLTILLIVILSLVIGLLLSFFIVKAGERAVLLTFGKPSDLAYGEGIHFKIPIAQHAVKMDVKTLKYETDASAASKDLQIVTTKIAVNYKIVPERVPELYRTVGLSYNDRIIQPSVQEVVKAITARFTAEELITRRPEVKDEIRDALRERMQSRGITIEDISIVNFDFSPSFNEAIEAKVTAEQLKLKAERDLERIRIEAEQKVTQAQAEATALKLQKQEITPDLVRLRQIEVQRQAIDKWDGVMPIVVGGATPFIDISAVSGGNRTI